MTITDFAFAPATTNIHVGDAITWTNNGPSPHTATAQDGSFDSGNLSQGQRWSHTFTQAGTFAYFCRVHPFMHATIVVSGGNGAATPASGTPAAGASAAPAGNSSTSATGTSTTAGASGNGTLPLTGLDLGATVLIGILLGAAGLALRRLTLARA